MRAAALAGLSEMEGLGKGAAGGSRLVRHQNLPSLDGAQQISVTVTEAWSELSGFAPRTPSNQARRKTITLGKGGAKCPEKMQVPQETVPASLPFSLFFLRPLLAQAGRGLIVQITIPGFQTRVRSEWAAAVASPSVAGDPIRRACGPGPVDAPSDQSRHADQRPGTGTRHWGAGDAVFILEGG